MSQLLGCNKLEELRANLASGSEKIIRIDLSGEGLNDLQFPVEEVRQVSSTLEVLNLGGNNFTEDCLEKNEDVIAMCTNLKIIFFAGNKFKRVPAVLGRLPNLYMLSFKSNCIETVPEESLSVSIGWLILTDNKITSLPSKVGQLTKLRKVMLASNLLAELPIEMSACKDIELIRLASNRLTSLPSWLLKLPKLSWCAFAGNVFNAPTSTATPTGAGTADPAAAAEPATEAADIEYANLEILEILGSGASGVVKRAVWRKSDKIDDPEKQDVAVKLFHGAATSDGLPEDEMRAMLACGALGAQEALLPVLGRLANAPADPSSGSPGLGLVLPLLPKSFRILGNPPSFDTCTRDTYPAVGVETYRTSGAVAGLLTEEQVLLLCQQTCGACVHLHSRGINHGDLYSHNILVQMGGASLGLAKDKDKGDGKEGKEDDGEDVRCILTDFGAASQYVQGGLDSDSGVQRLEVRAFGCLVDDLLMVLQRDKVGAVEVVAVQETDSIIIGMLRNVRDACMGPVEQRPLFLQIAEMLQL